MPLLQNISDFWNSISTTLDFFIFVDIILMFLEKNEVFLFLIFILVLTSEFHIHSYRRIFFFLCGIGLFSNLGIKV